METTINGIKTNYKIFDGSFSDKEERKSFIILHGWGSNSGRWELIAEKIAEKGFNVIVPDLPGFGESQQLERPWTVNDYVKWFEDLTKELSVQDFYLMGHSFGGALAAKISVKYPQRVKKLFLVAAAVVRKKTTKKKISEKISKFVKLFYFLPYYSFFRKAVYKFIIRRSDYIYTDGIMKKTYLNVISDDISFNLPFIRVPTVIIWGEKDKSTPVEDANFIKEKIKNSKLIIIPEADHLIHKQLPELLTEKVLENI